MGKIHTKVYRKDQSLEDHSHKLPDGTYTGGALYKPNKDRTFLHSHLYQYEGKTIESGLAPIGGDHTHVTECGITSGPVPVRKDAQQDVTRSDFITREGSSWVVKSESGQTLGKHPTKEEAIKQLQAVEANK